MQIEQTKKKCCHYYSFTHSHFSYESVMKNVVDVAFLFLFLVVTNSSMIFYVDLLGINTLTIVRIL